MLQAGMTAEQALKALTAGDPHADVRQCAMVDAAGNVAAHTGAKCIPAAGHRLGDAFSCQANLMEKDTVWAAMADAFLEMQRAAVADEISREDWLGLLLDREATSRENKRLGHRLRQARLRHSAVIEDTDYRTPRGLDRALFHKLATCEWIRASQHLVIGGPTGIGKSWLACALGHKACREGLSVLYRRASRLFAELATARGEGRLSRLMSTLERTRLLIIDDWGPEPLTAEQRRDLLEIVDDRYEKGSLLITSQIPIGRWHEVIADHTIGDAILDRVIHRAHRLELKGPSMRKRHNAEVSATAQA